MQCWRVVGLGVSRWDLIESDHERVWAFSSSVWDCWSLPAPVPRWRWPPRAIAADPRRARRVRLTGTRIGHRRVVTATARRPRPRRANRPPGRAIGRPSPPVVLRTNLPTNPRTSPRASRRRTTGTRPVTVARTARSRCALPDLLVVIGNLRRSRTRRNPPLKSQRRPRSTAGRTASPVCQRRPPGPTRRNRRCRPFPRLRSNPTWLRSPRCRRSAVPRRLQTEAGCCGCAR